MDSFYKFREKHSDFIKHSDELNRLYHEEINRLKKIIIQKEKYIVELERKVNLSKNFCKEIRTELQTLKNK